jgi:ABC-type antimicrobial peptide transport system permease subunit
VGGDVLTAGWAMQKQIAPNPSIPPDAVEAPDERVAKLILLPRFRANVLSLFALGALLQSAVGLHGVLAQLVTQRTPEFGVRRAVGAQTSDLLMLVARQGGIPVLGGLAGGFVCTLAVRRALASLLYGIEPADPATMAAVSLILLAVAAIAIALPARRAARTDPAIALREE